MTNDQVIESLQNRHVYVLYHCPECGVQTAAAPYKGNNDGDLIDLTGLHAAVAEALRMAYARHDARHTRCRFRPAPEDVRPNVPLYPSPVQQI